LVQLNIAFLDEEEAYLEQLKGYLVRKKEVFFKIRTFTRAEAFEKSCGKETYDAVVMTAFFWEAVNGTSGRAKCIFLCEDTDQSVPADCLYVRKYQPAEKLMCQISAMLWQQEPEEAGYFPQNTAELIGIYSPVHHEDQMLFGMTMAQILGETGKVLYVNLMGHSGFYGMTKADADADVGDLFYEMMQGGHDFATGLHKIRQSYRNFDYIPPVANPEHLSEVSKPLYETFLAELKNCSGYDTVLVDFGTVFLGFAEMLPLFHTFYCIGKEGIQNRCRTEEFLEYLNREGEHTAKRMTRLLLPGELPAARESSPLDSSLYGGLGDFIRGCLYGGAEIGG